MVSAGGGSPSGTSCFRGAFVVGSQGCFISFFFQEVPVMAVCTFDRGFLESLLDMWKRSVRVDEFDGMKAFNRAEAISGGMGPLDKIVGINNEYGIAYMRQAFEMLDAMTIVRNTYGNFGGEGYLRGKAKVLEGQGLWFWCCMLDGSSLTNFAALVQDLREVMTEYRKIDGSVLHV